MTRLAVTGGAGFVGRHTLPLLLEAGQQPRALLRPGSSTVLPEGVEAVRGDVRNLEVVRSLLADAEIAVHLAASFAPQDDTAEIIELGTRNLVQAAQETGVKRLVYVSCMGAEAAASSAFYRAKWKAESYLRGSGLPVTILRPSLILGSGDGVTAPLASLIRALPAVPVPGRGEQRTQPVDVADMARCLLRAVEDDSLTGETLDVGGPMFVTFRQLVDLISGRLGVFKPKVLVPERWLPLVVQALPVARPLFSEPRLALFRQGIVASPGSVQRSFGFEPVSIVQRLNDYFS